MSYFLIWLTVLVASTVLFKQVSGSLSLLKPNLNSIIYYYSFLVSSFVGTLLIVNHWDHYYMINKLDHPSYRVIGFAVISAVMILFPLTQLVISKLVGFDAKKEYEQYSQKPIAAIFTVRTELYFLFAALSAISILACAYTLLKTHPIPLLSLLTGHTEELTKLRISASREFAGNIFIRNIFAIALTPLLSIIAYVYSVKTNEAKWKLLFLCLFACSIVMSIYNLEKSPIFFYFIMFLMVRIYIGKTKITPFKITVLGTFGLALLIVMYVFIQKVHNLDEYLSFSSGPLGRLFLAQIAPTYLHLDIFGNSIPFLHGRSLPSLLTNLFDQEQVRSARMVMANIFPKRIEEGTGGVLNTLYIAEAYANFGYFGIVAGTIYIAALIQMVFICFIRLPKNPVFVSLFIYFAINIPRTLVGGFTDFLFNPIWILITCLFVGMLLFIRVRMDVWGMWQKHRSKSGM